jgi:hypothetical protein
VPDVPESERRYVRVQLRSGNGADDGGEIAEGSYTLAGNRLSVSDASGRLLGTRLLRHEENPEAEARSVLRAGRTGFNGPLRYWPQGIV